MLVDERGHVGCARSAGHDELEGMRRQESQRQVTCAAALANTERRGCRPGGLAIVTRLEESELLRHRGEYNTSANRNATACRAVTESDCLEPRSAARPAIRRPLGTPAPT